MLDLLSTDGCPSEDILAQPANSMDGIDVLHNYSYAQQLLMPHGLELQHALQSPDQASSGLDSNPIRDAAENSNSAAAFRPDRLAQSQQLRGLVRSRSNTAASAGNGTASSDGALGMQQANSSSLPGSLRAGTVSSSSQHRGCSSLGVGEDVDVHASADFAGALTVPRLHPANAGSKATSTGSDLVPGNYNENSLSKVLSLLHQAGALPQRGPKPGTAAAPAAASPSSKQQQQQQSTSGSGRAQGGQRLQLLGRAGAVFPSGAELLSTSADEGANDSSFDCAQDAQAKRHFIAHHKGSKQQVQGQHGQAQHGDKYSPVQKGAWQDQLYDSLYLIRQAGRPPKPATTALHRCLNAAGWETPQLEQQQQQTGIQPFGAGPLPHSGSNSKLASIIDKAAAGSLPAQQQQQQDQYGPRFAAEGNKRSTRKRTRTAKAIEADEIDAVLESSSKRRSNSIAGKGGNSSRNKGYHQQQCYKTYPQQQQHNAPSVLQQLQQAAEDMLNSSNYLGNGAANAGSYTGKYASIFSDMSVDDFLQGAHAGALPRPTQQQQQHGTDTPASRAATPEFVAGLQGSSPVLTDGLDILGKLQQLQGAFAAAAAAAAGAATAAAVGAGGKHARVKQEGYCEPTGSQDAALIYAAFKSLHRAASSGVDDASEASGCVNSGETTTAAAGQQTPRPASPAFAIAAAAAAAVAANNSAAAAAAQLMGNWAGGSSNTTEPVHPGALMAPPEAAALAKPSQFAATAMAAAAPPFTGSMLAGAGGCADYYQQQQSWYDVSYGIDAQQTYAYSAASKPPKAKSAAQPARYSTATAATAATTAKKGKGRGVRKNSSRGGGRARCSDPDTSAALAALTALANAAEGVSRFVGDHARDQDAAAADAEQNAGSSAAAAAAGYAVNAAGSAADGWHAGGGGVAAAAGGSKQGFTDNHGGFDEQAGRAARGPRAASRYIGVTWRERIQRWEVYVWASSSKRSHYIGAFPTSIHAARAYDVAVLWLMGQDARPRTRLNFPLSDYNLEEIQAEASAVAAMRQLGTPMTASQRGVAAAQAAQAAAKQAAAAVGNAVGGGTGLVQMRGRSNTHNTYMSLAGTFAGDAAAAAAVQAAVSMQGGYHRVLAAANEAAGIPAGRTSSAEQGAGADAANEDADFLNQQHPASAAEAEVAAFLVANATGASPEVAAAEGCQQTAAPADGADEGHGGDDVLLLPDTAAAAQLEAAGGLMQLHKSPSKQQLHEQHLIQQHEPHQLSDQVQQHAAQQQHQHQQHDDGQQRGEDGDDGLSSEAMQAALTPILEDTDALHAGFSLTPGPASQDVKLAYSAR